MKRRHFITLVAGATIWSVQSLAQDRGGVRRVGILMDLAENDPEGRARVASLLLGLTQIGWKNGGNLSVETRWGAGNSDLLRRHAAELVGQSPDVIVGATSVSVDALLPVIRAIPLVFVQVVDPVGGGYVESLSHPGGNATGFSNFEYGASGKWLELLKEISPNITRVAVIRDAAIAAGPAQLGAIQAVAPAFKVELFPVNVREKIEDAVLTFARTSGGGLIVTASPWAVSHRRTILELAARLKLPAIYSQRAFVVDGGLMSYGPSRVDQYRRAATYVDRILKGEKPADLPVQAPVKYDLSINLNTAKALSLDVPASLLGQADEIFE
jgi:putative tryptophan/tyrosine transport system substrate-binding protein